MNHRRCVRRSVKPIEPGDYVQFAYLPSSMKVTPVLVTAIAPNGMVEIYGRGWFQPYLLMKVDPPAQQNKTG